MADTGVKYPATISTVQETGDDNDWTTPANVGADDAAYASITAASFDNLDTSYLLKATNISAGIPSGATINGILVEIERHYANGAVADYDVCLTKDGSTRAGDDKSTGAAFPAADAITSFGGSTDLWGTTWTEAEINATTFGVLYKMQATANNADGYVDFIRVTVYYTAAPASISDSQPAYARGHTALTDVQPAYAGGHIALTDAQPAYGAGYGSLADSQPAYAAGTPFDITDSQPAYARGYGSLADSQPAYGRGHSAASDSQPSYARGHTGIADSQPSFAHGYGSLADSQPAHAYGHSIIADSQPAYARGLASIQASQAAYAEGATAGGGEDTSADMGASGWGWHGGYD